MKVCVPNLLGGCAVGMKLRCSDLLRGSAVGVEIGTSDLLRSGSVRVKVGIADALRIPSVGIEWLRLYLSASRSTLWDWRILRAVNLRITESSNWPNADAKSRRESAKM